MTKIFTIDDLKRALVEVATICSRYEPTCGVTSCPFWSDNRKDCALTSYRPDFWDVVGWKEKKNDAGHGI